MALFELVTSRYYLLPVTYISNNVALFELVTPRYYLLPVTYISNPVWRVTLFIVTVRLSVTHLSNTSCSLLPK